MIMSLSEALGYLASVLVFTTFYMKTMVVLRFVAIASNFAFIGYGLAENLHPVLLLHLALLPMNFHRLVQAQREEALAGSPDDAGVRESLMVHMTRRELNRGETVFARGDPAGSIFYLAGGMIALPEENVKVETGGAVGLEDLLSGRRVRDSSAVCETDCELLELSGAAISELPDRDREGGLAFLNAIAGQIKTRSRLGCGKQSRGTPAIGPMRQHDARKPTVSWSSAGPPPWSGQADRPLWRTASRMHPVRPSMRTQAIGGVQARPVRDGQRT